MMTFSLSTNLCPAYLIHPVSLETSVNLTIEQSIIAYYLDALSDLVDDPLSLHMALLTRLSSPFFLISLKEGTKFYSSLEFLQCFKVFVHIFACFLNIVVVQLLSCLRLFETS